MNAVIYRFPTLQPVKKSKKLEIKDVEKYADIFSHRSKYENLKNIIEESKNINRVFKGCYNTFGIIPEQNYKKLLSFYNEQTKDSWENIKNFRIIETLTVEDIYKSSTSYNESKVPNINLLIEHFEYIKNKKELEILSKFDYYDNLIKEMESSHLELKTLFKS